MSDPNRLADVSDGRRKWEAATLRPHLERQPERKERFSTISDLPIDRLYGPDDLRGFDPSRDLGLPGEYPFTRGIHSTMYRERLWTMRQYVGFGTPTETNGRFKYLMAHGQDALNVAFDLPTQLGLDSDDPRAEGEVGRVGMAIDTLADMEDAFAGIPLDRSEEHTSELQS